MFLTLPYQIYGWHRVCMERGQWRADAITTTELGLEEYFSAIIGLIFSQATARVLTTIIVDVAITPSCFWVQCEAPWQDKIYQTITCRIPAKSTGFFDRFIPVHVWISEGMTVGRLRTPPLTWNPIVGLIYFSQVINNFMRCKATWHGYDIIQGLRSGLEGLVV